MEEFKDRRVCVVGGAGMIGSRLVEFLLQAGSSVTVLDDFSRGHTEISGAKYIRGDATNLNTCRYAFRGASTSSPPVDMVFNLAAKVAGVMYNMNHHLDMFHNNINVLTIPVMAAEELGVEHYLQTSSVCVFDPDHNHPCLEEEGLLGEPHKSNFGYSWAKRMGEYAVIMSDIPHAVIVRPSNVYGIRDYFDERAHVIPALMKKVHNDGTIRVNGTPDTVREFIYADDVAKGMMAAIVNGQDKGQYILGVNGEAVSIEQLLHLLQMIAGADKEVVFSEQRGENKRWSNCSLTYDELNWRPSMGLREGLTQVYEWALERRVF